MHPHKQKVCPSLGLLGKLRFIATWLNQAVLSCWLGDLLRLLEKIYSLRDCSGFIRGNRSEPLKPPALVKAMVGGFDFEYMPDPPRCK
jgi:hypothetical protein